MVIITFSSIKMANICFFPIYICLLKRFLLISFYVFYLSKAFLYVINDKCLLICTTFQLPFIFAAKNLLYLLFNFLIFLLIVYKCHLFFTSNIFEFLLLIFSGKIQHNLSLLETSW